MLERKILKRKENQEVQHKNNDREILKDVQEDVQVRKQVDMVAQKEHDFSKDDDTTIIISTTGRVIKKNQLDSRGIGTRPKISPQNKTSSDKQTSTIINNSISNKVKPRERKLKFDDKYQRITTYLENELHATVMELKKLGDIDSITSLINTAIKEYLKKI